MPVPRYPWHWAAPVSFAASDAIAWWSAGCGPGACHWADSGSLGLDQLDHARKVQRAMAAQAVRGVEIARQAAERRRGAHRGGVLLRQAQVLQHQVGAEAARIALGR